jgi:hypothetical protein
MRTSASGLVTSRLDLSARVAASSTKSPLTTTPHNNLPFHFLFADALYDSLQRFTLDYPASVSRQTLEPFAHQLTELHVVF